MKIEETKGGALNWDFMWDFKRLFKNKSLVVFNQDFYRI